MNIGCVGERECIVEGRRIPLSDIRLKTMNRFLEAGIIRKTDADITWHLMVWADHASVMNNGHLLLTVKTIYSPELFFTDEEMLQKGEKVWLNLM